MSYESGPGPDQSFVYPGVSASAAGPDDKLRGANYGCFSARKQLYRSRLQCRHVKSARHCPLMIWWISREDVSCRYPECKTPNLLTFYKGRARRCNRARVTFTLCSLRFTKVIWVFPRLPFTDFKAFCFESVCSEASALDVNRKGSRRLKTAGPIQASFHSMIIPCPWRPVIWLLIILLSNETRRAMVSS